MVGGRVIEHSVDDAGSVEADQDRKPTGDRGRLVAAHLLHPPEVDPDVWPLGLEWVQVLLGAPDEVAAEVGLGVNAGLALASGQVGSDCQPESAVGELGEGREDLSGVHPPTAPNLRGERQCGVSGTLCHVRGMVGRSRDASPGRWMLRARERRCR